MGKRKKYSLSKTWQLCSSTIWLVLVLFIGTGTQADDIDVYNTVNALPYPPYTATGDVAPPNPNYPNILFVLDASWSMYASDSGQIGTRIHRLREAMEKVLTNAEKINIALMRFSHRSSGGRVIYPMSPIEYAREDAIDMINTMSLDWYTPTTGAMLEAAYYFRGEPVYYGTTRSRAIYNRKHRAVELTRLSHPDSYTGGVIVRDDECTEANLDHPSCVTERIDNDPVYRSPILSECQQNYMVLLSDGAASKLVDYTEIQSLIGQSCNSAVNCGVAISEFLATQDQSDTHPGVNTVTTHTVGFNTVQAALVQYAAAGDGQYYQSSSADDLVTAMTNIIESVNIPSATLATPGIAIDTANRLAHRNDLYLPLFKPALQPIWTGNLKGYWLDGVLKDYSDPRISAIDPNTNTFVDSAKSMWSASPDGADITRGGAASKIKSPDSRSIVTNHPQGTRFLWQQENEFNADNISAQHLALPDHTLSLTELDAEDIISWVRGTDVKDANENGDITEQRRQYADPLHTNPVIATYGKQTNGLYDSVVFFGTNDGFLNAVETLSGEDLFSFIPWDLMGNVKHSYVNLPYGKKLYGMDGYLSNWFHDENQDGYIDPVSDHFYLYAGMRRGGRNYYALDVSTKADPELLWTIKGGTGEFIELGQSWSKMVSGKMRHPASGIVTDVLVFSGGYDPNHDQTLNRLNASMGNAIFIIDASTGELIWKAGASASSFDSDDMKYAIAATPTLIDINVDGIFDQMYASDLGGQIWRFDFAPDGAISGGVIARMSSADDENKPFFASPDVSLIQPEDGNVKIAVSIGSGARQHPLDQTQKNAFYVFFLPDVHNAPAGYGVKDEDGEYRAMTADDLVDITKNNIIEGSELERSETRSAIANMHGWYIDMEAVGEKVLNTSLTIDNRIVFTSYVPATFTACTGGLGNSYVYTVNIFDGTPATDQDNDSELTKSDRIMELETPGLSAPPSIVFQDNEDEKASIKVGTETIAVPNINLVRRTYWTEIPGF